MTRVSLPLVSGLLAPCSAFDLELPATVIFDYPTVEALASMLALQASDAAVAPQLLSASTGAADSASDSEPYSDDEAAEADYVPDQQLQLMARRSGSDHEQEQPNTQPGALLAAPLPPVNKKAPSLTKPGYFTVSKHLRRQDGSASAAAPAPRHGSLWFSGGT